MGAVGGSGIPRASAKSDPVAFGRALQSSLRHRGVRLRELAVGTAVLAASVGLFVAMSSDEPGGAVVLVAAVDVARGERIDSKMLGTAVVSSDEDLPYLPVAEADVVAGLLAGVDLPAGTPLLASMLQERSPLGPAEALVGVTVDASKAPIELAAGDRVRLVIVRDDIEDGRVISELDTFAVVWSVGVVDDLDGERSVSLRIPLSAASLIAGHDDVNIVKVGE